MAQVKYQSKYKSIYDLDINILTADTSEPYLTGKLTQLNATVRPAGTKKLTKTFATSYAALSFKQLDGNERWVFGYYKNSDAAMNYLSSNFVVIDRWDTTNIIVIHLAQGNLVFGHALSGNTLAYNSYDPATDKYITVLHDLLTGRIQTFTKPTYGQGYKSAVALRGNLLLIATQTSTSVINQIDAYNIGVTPAEYLWSTTIPYAGASPSITDIEIGGRYAYVSDRNATEDPNGNPLPCKGIVRLLDLQSNGALMSAWWITRGDNTYTDASKHFGSKITYDPEFLQVYVAYGASDQCNDVQRFTFSGTFLETLDPAPASNPTYIFSLGYDDYSTKLPTVAIDSGTTGWTTGKIFSIDTSYTTLSKTPLYTGAPDSQVMSTSHYCLGMSIGHYLGNPMSYAMRDIKGIDVLCGRSLGRKW